MGLPVYDTVASGVAAAGGTGDVSWNHVVGSGSDRALFIFVGGRGLLTISTPTVDGSSTGVTLVRLHDDGNGNVVEACYRLLNPATGTLAIVAPTDASTYPAVAASISLSNVHQTTPVSADNSAGDTTGASNAVTVDVTSNTGELVIGATICTADYSFTSTGTGQTERVDILSGDGNGAISLATQTGATTTTHSYTISTGREWGVIAASIAGTAGGAAAANLILAATSQLHTGSVMIGRRYV